MPKRDVVLGKRYNKAYSISFSHVRNIRRQGPNIQSKRIWNPDTKQWVRLDVSTSAIKLISRLGSRKVLAMARKKGK